MPVDVTWQAVDVDRVTRRFYDRFQTAHTAFLPFIQGIQTASDAEWYASVLLNRLMLVYFLQKKGFLDGDPDYLRHRLEKVQARQGKSPTFYRHFLVRLFREGLGRPPAQRVEDLNEFLGQVPYLNGDLFDVHELERTYPQIDVADDAFARLFDFFDAYQWRLDERPLRADNEINPDILGTIFEKHINQKQMGAYYTKEDITGYIARNTIVPFLFHAAAKQCAVAFQLDGAVWRLLRDDPDRYIYPALGHSICWDARTRPPRPLAVPLPLPPEVEAGLTDAAKRIGWNGPAAPEYALPTETWRESVARRQRCQELQAKLKAGEIRAINDLITCNLDLCRFAEDVIENCEEPELLRAFYHAIEKVSVLDPTCGSGAFLFAALNVLEPLHEACLDRMQGFLEGPACSGDRRHSEDFSDFRKVMEEAARHSNRRYFILKSIILNNLHGVDIMEEAVEICKLRLILKLVAQLESVPQLEPLPNIDFNIRPGNTFVGFVSLGEVRKTLEGNPGLGKEDVERIVEQAKSVDRAFQDFRALQIGPGMDVARSAAAKAELRQRLEQLREELDRYLAGDYELPPDQARALQQWRASHLPFHWFAEFQDVMRRGGFDVIIGNPPYVELSDGCNQYRTRGLQLIQTGNLFSISVERFAQLLPPQAIMGVIVPMSAVSTPRMLPLMTLLCQEFSPIYISNFAVRPGKLFVGVDMNLSIVTAQKQSAPRATADEVFTTRYNRWSGEYRPFLFGNLQFARSSLNERSSCIPKLGLEAEARLLERILALGTGKKHAAPAEAGDTVYYHSGGRYFRKCLRDKLSNEYKELRVRKGWGDVFICLLSSSLYYWFWVAISDCYHVTRRDIEALPIPDSLVREPLFASLAESLLKDLWKNATTRNRQRADGTQQQEVNFNVALSKPLLDQIDGLLARHYGLSDEEIELILNYDVKHRLDAEPCLHRRH